MNDVWIKLIEQSPWAAAIILTVWMFLNDRAKSEDKRLAHEKELEGTRIAAAKDREQERRSHELTIANMQAQNMKQLIEYVEAQIQKQTQALDEHEKASQDRYERQNNTKELMTAVKEQKGRR